MDSKRTCQICAQPARLRETYYSHYGAVCCLSCKAFFRRIFREGTRNPDSLACKKSGTCSLQAGKRKKCRKCRFDKCILIGMSPGLVPNDEESKKYTYKKKSKKKKTSPEVAALQSMLASFTETVLEMQLRVDARLLEQVITSHDQLPNWTQESTACVLRCLRLMQDLFFRFALKSQYFLSLHPNDQQMLVKKNWQLFYCYILGRYLGAYTKVDQVSWLFLPSMPGLGECKKQIRV